MPPRKRVTARPPALTDDDVAALRARVAAGEKPRVVVRTASAAVPAGTRGNVIRVGNPADGEFIVVRLGRDQVPFAPTELAVTGRSGRIPATPATPTPARSTAAKRSPARTSKAKTTKSSAARTTTKAATKPAAAPEPAATPARKTSTRTARSGRRTSRRTPSPLTVTLRFNDGAWTVEAARGARRLAKASALRPGAVAAFAELVDETQVREALTETVESCRAVVEERAQQLRAELQAAEASLKEYEARRR